MSLNKQRKNSSKKRRDIGKGGASRKGQKRTAATVKAEKTEITRAARKAKNAGHVALTGVGRNSGNAKTAERATILKETLHGQESFHKLSWKGGNMIYPLPAVMVSCGDGETSNIITIGWTGTICTNPPMLYISVRPERYSYEIIKKTGEFVVNLTTESLAFATDYCGVKSGRTVNKWTYCNLTEGKADNLEFAPIIRECPVNIECKVHEIVELGSHHMFIASVEGIQVTKDLMDDNGKFRLNDSGLLAYSHGSYLALGKEIGTFGYSIRKKPNGKVSNAGTKKKKRNGKK